MLKVFIAGIMQGSRLDHLIDEQHYRDVITQAILAWYPDAEVLDPNVLHPNGVDYDDQQAKATFLEMAALAGQSDLLVAYVPEASMGTAVEIWQGFKAGIPIVTISPMAANWVVRHLSNVVLPDLTSFRHWALQGGFDELLSDRGFDKSPNLV